MTKSRPESAWCKRCRANLIREPDKKFNSQLGWSGDWLMFGHLPVGHIKKRFGKGEFQHDLPILVGDFDGRAQQAGVLSLGSQHFAYHGTRNLPSAVWIT